MDEVEQEQQELTYMLHEAMKIFMASEDTELVAMLTEQQRAIIAYNMLTFENSNQFAYMLANDNKTVAKAVYEELKYFLR